MKAARWTFICLLAVVAGAAAASDEAGPSFALEGGVSYHGTYRVGAAIAWAWRWRKPDTGGEWTGATEVSVSHLSERVQDEAESRTLVGAVPVFRYRFAGTEWFAQAGVGLSWTDALYRADGTQFSTEFNFISVLGIGRSFGPRHEQDLSLRLSHISNGGIKKPNPGENFLQLRYTWAR